MTKLIKLIYVFLVTNPVNNATERTTIIAYPVIMTKQNIDISKKLIFQYQLKLKRVISNIVWQIVHMDMNLKFFKIQTKITNKKPYV